MTAFFMQGFTNDFRFGDGYGNCHLKSALKSMAGAVSNPKVVKEYISNKISLSHVAGPFQRNKNNQVWSPQTSQKRCMKTDS